MVHVLETVGIVVQQVVVFLAHQVVKIHVVEVVQKIVFQLVQDVQIDVLLCVAAVVQAHVVLAVKMDVLEV